MREDPGEEMDPERKDKRLDGKHPTFRRYPQGSGGMAACRRRLIDGPQIKNNRLIRRKKI